MKLTLNISPCPNDTFMFEAMVNGRVDTRGLTFDVHFADIEELNRAVMGVGVSGCVSSVSSDLPEPDVSKISYAVLGEIGSRYELLDSGSALGFGNGPVLVAREGGVDADADKISVAVPGIHTTANLLIQKLYPEFTDRTPVLFSDIAPAIARGEYDAGVLIHEGRFTYREHGLELVADLGVEWGRTTASPAAPNGLPLPLGAIVASRTLPSDVRRTFETVLRSSIEYGFANPSASREFIRAHAQEMANDVIDNHISLFVNDNSLSLSPEARKAIFELTEVRI